LEGGVETGLFSSLLSVVNDDYRILTWKVCARKWSWSIFAWQDLEKPENFRQLFSVIVESDTGHLLVCYRIAFCMVSLHRHLYIYSSYDYDCDQQEHLLRFLFDGTEPEKYQVLFCY